MSNIYKYSKCFFLHFRNKNIIINIFQHYSLWSFLFFMSKACQHPLWVHLCILCEQVSLDKAREHLNCLWWACWMPPADGDDFHGTNFSKVLDVIQTWEINCSTLSKELLKRTDKLQTVLQDLKLPLILKHLRRKY